MKGIDKNIFLVLMLIAFIVGHYFFSFDYVGYSDLITFLSIMVGFKITSLSILFNSPLKKTLYDRKIKNYKTELHRLKDYYKFSVIFEVVSLAAIFIIPNETISFNVRDISVQLGKYLIIMPILFGTIYCFFKVYIDLLKIFAHPTNN